MPATEAQSEAELSTAVGGPGANHGEHAGHHLRQQGEDRHASEVDPAILRCDKRAHAAASQTRIYLQTEAPLAHGDGKQVTRFRNAPEAFH